MLLTLALIVVGLLVVAGLARFATRPVAPDESERFRRASDLTRSWADGDAAPRQAVEPE